MSIIKTTAAILALLTLTTANPIEQRQQQQQPPPTIPKDQEFRLALRAQGYPVISLNIAHIEAGKSQAIFQRLAAYPGTPAYLSDTYLNFDVDTPNPYSMTFADPDVHGSTTPVYATIGADSGRDGLSIVNGTLQAKRTAASQGFFVCPTNVNGDDIAGLFWGVYNLDGSAPEGCTTAELIQNFTVEGGAKPPTS